MSTGKLLVGAAIAEYFGAVAYFFLTEKDLLISSVNTYAPVEVGSIETASVLGLLAFMTLGYLRGLKKLIFALFTYHVPVKLLRGEYERYFTEAGQGQNIFTIILGLLLLAMSAAGFVGLKYHPNLPEKPKVEVTELKTTEDGPIKKKKK